MNTTISNRARDLRRQDGGFTLIELLIVIVILGVLAAIVVFSVRGITDRGDESACEADVKSAAVAVEAYYAQEGDWPPALQDVVDDGYLRSLPADVTYDNTDGSTVGAAGSPCAGFVG